MLLTDEDVQEFYDACRKDGFDLTCEDARFYALRMLRLYEIICRPLSSSTPLANSNPDVTIEAPAVGPGNTASLL
jgi:hypothetical protein